MRSPRSRRHSREKIFSRRSLSSYGNSLMPLTMFELRDYQSDNGEVMAIQHADGAQSTFGQDVRPADRNNAKCGGDLFCIDDMVDEDRIMHEFRCTLYVNHNLTRSGRRLNSRWE